MHLIFSRVTLGESSQLLIIKQLSDILPECKIVNGRPGHPQSQRSVDDNGSTGYGIGYGTGS